MNLRILSLILLMALPVSAEAATEYYTYSDVDLEFEMVLPDAPTGYTLWGDNATVPIPFVPSPAKAGDVGEVAVLKIVDPETADMFEVRVTSVDASPEFLKTLTRERMEAEAKNALNGLKIDQEKTNYAASGEVLKWATYTGYNIDRDNNLFFHAVHFMSGEKTVMMIKVSYNPENKLFTEHYNKLNQSIRYTGK